jgi:hypothetical protein
MIGIQRISTLSNREMPAWKAASVETIMKTGLSGTVHSLCFSPEKGFLERKLKTSLGSSSPTGSA